MTCLALPKKRPGLCWGFSVQSLRCPAGRFVFRMLLPTPHWPQVQRLESEDKAASTHQTHLHSNMLVALAQGLPEQQHFLSVVGCISTGKEPTLTPWEWATWKTCLSKPAGLHTRFSTRLVAVCILSHHKCCSMCHAGQSLNPRAFSLVVINADQPHLGQQQSLFPSSSSHPPPP